MTDPTLPELARLDRLVAELRAENDVLKQELRERLDHAEFWRRTAIAWQDWAADQLTAIGKQIDGGRWGSVPARKILGEQLQAAEVSAKLLTDQRDAARSRVAELEQGSTNWERLQMETVRVRDRLRSLLRTANERLKAAGAIPIEVP